ncbi:UNVERIFIED_CONTAM: hypothetical protein GTU68_028228 [Idotea baltica]|nr:hypothetical protein [Idotea baltica]
MDTTLGLTKRLGVPSPKDSVLVAALLKQGAIPFVKTNVPQIIYRCRLTTPTRSNIQ